MFSILQNLDWAHPLGLILLGSSVAGAFIQDVPSLCLRAGNALRILCRLWGTVLLLLDKVAKSDDLAHYIMSN